MLCKFFELITIQIASVESKMSETEVNVCTSVTEMSQQVMPVGSEPYLSRVVCTTIGHKITYLSSQQHATTTNLTPIAGKMYNSTAIWPIPDEILTMSWLPK